MHWHCRVRVMVMAWRLRHDRWYCGIPPTTAPAGVATIASGCLAGSPARQLGRPNDASDWLRRRPRNGAAVAEFACFNHISLDPARLKVNPR
jgi:hypothetical protein